MRELYRYSLRGRSIAYPPRVIRMTVTAHDPDDARRIAQMRNPDFGTTLPRTGVRRGARVVLEEPDAIDQWKAYVESPRATVEVDVA